MDATTVNRCPACEAPFTYPAGQYTWNCTCGLKIERKLTHAELLDMSRSKCRVCDMKGIVPWIKVIHTGEPCLMYGMPCPACPVGRLAGQASEGDLAFWNDWKLYVDENTYDDGSYRSYSNYVALNKQPMLERYWRAEKRKTELAKRKKEATHDGEEGDADQDGEGDGPGSRLRPVAKGPAEGLRQGRAWHEQLVRDGASRPVPEGQEGCASRPVVRVRGRGAEGDGGAQDPAVQGRPMPAVRVSDFGRAVVANLHKLRRPVERPRYPEDR